MCLCVCVFITKSVLYLKMEEEEGLMNRVEARIRKQRKMMSWTPCAHLINRFNLLFNSNKVVFVVALVWFLFVCLNHLLSLVLGM